MKTKDDYKPLFDAGDLLLIEEGLTLFEDLHMVLYAAKLGRKTMKYPVKSPEDLAGIFGSKKVFQFRDWKISYKTFLKFAPQEFFPMETEKDFLMRMLMIFQIARRTHQFDTMQQGSVKPFSEKENVYLIPTPEPIPYYPNK